MFRSQREATRPRTSSELGLNRGERVLLAIGINVASAVIALSSRRSGRRHHW